MPVQTLSYVGAWEYVLSQLRGEMARADYDSYVSTLKPLSFKEGVFRVGAPSSYTRDWAMTRLRVKVSKLLELVLFQKVDLRFTLVTGDDRHGWVEAQLPLAIAEPAEEEQPANGDGANSSPQSPTSANPTTSPQPSNHTVPSGLQVAQGATGNGGTDNGSANPASAASPDKAQSEPGQAASPALKHVNQDDAVADTSPGPASIGAEIAEHPINGRKGEGRKKKTETDDSDQGSPRKIRLQRAYGTERARVVQPERGMFLTLYFLNNWLPLLGHSAMTTVLAARALCYWNPMTGELRNVIETDMGELARRAAVSVRTVKDVLNNELVKKYFLRYKVRRVMTPNGVRTAGIILQVRMDDPLTPEDQDEHKLPEDERWYTADFEDEQEE